MAEFHIGDKVFVVMGMRPISFTVKSIHIGAGGRKYCSPVEQGQHGELWPEERLDYDLSEEQKDTMRLAESALFNVAEGFKTLRSLTDRINNLPPNMAEIYKRWITEEMNRA